MMRFAASFAFALAVLAAGCASIPEPSRVERTPSQALAAPQETPLGQLVDGRRGGEQARADSAFRLLDTVEAAYAARLALIEGASKTLDLQYYAIHADSSTEILFEKLRDAARRGVRVRLLLDDFNTTGRDAQVLRLAFAPNVQIRLFNPIPGSRGSMVGRLLGTLTDVGQLQQRMHNKVFIADNAVGITGGRNLGDVYFGQGGKSNFIDLDILAAGRIVRDMSASFDHYWNAELAYPVESLMSAADIAKFKAPEAPAEDKPASLGLGSAGSVMPGVTKTVAPAAAALDLRGVTLTWAPAALLADKPGKIGADDGEASAQDTVIDGLLQLLNGAQRDVLVISPYFVPGGRMLELFGQLRQRGVRIRVLTNSLASNDAPAAHAGYSRYRPALLRMGVELYEMRSTQNGAEVGLSGSSGTGGLALGGSAGGGSGSGGTTGSKFDGGSDGSPRASLHSKAVVIDGVLLVVGSMNLDLRSQLQNTEVALLIRSRALAAQATQQVEKTFAGGAYRVETREGGGLVWRAPPNAGFADAASEPDASTKLKMLVNIIGPFAPDEML